jgi:hypothetical protein
MTDRTTLLRPAWSSRRGWPVLLAALLAAGCGGEGGLREYRSAEGRFSVRVPGTPRPDREEQVRKGLVKMSVVERSGNFSVA